MPERILFSVAADGVPQQTIDALAEHIRVTLGATVTQTVSVTDPTLVAQVRAEYGCEDINVDDGAAVIHVDGEGAWVQGWLWYCGGE